MHLDLTLLLYFLSLVSSYYFIKIFIKNIKTFKNYLIYFISTLTMLTIWPQSLAIFVGQGVFLLIFFVDLKRIFFLALIFLSYILINLDYLFYLTEILMDIHHLKISFYKLFF